MSLTANRIYRLVGMVVIAGLPLLAWSADEAQPVAPALSQSQQQVAERKPPTGWRRMMRGDTVYWCTKDAKAKGSRVRKEAVCVTPQQYDMVTDTTQKAMYDMFRTARPPSGG